jgi:hypothetical protein
MVTQSVAYECDAELSLEVIKHHIKIQKDVIERRKEELAKRKVTEDRAKQAMNILKIPLHQNAYIDPVELYDIFTDENKLKVLISKLRNKAFW